MKLFAFKEPLIAMQAIEENKSWRPLMGTLPAAVQAVVEGDISRLSSLLEATPSEIQVAAAALHQLSLSRSALARVLQEWRNGHCVANEVQQWASFIRRGYVSGKAVGAPSTINIEYDTRDEELIVEILGRLDELGDLIDGYIGDDERDQFIRALQK